MWTRNKKRLQTSSNYYKLHDSYSMPQYLRNARTKHQHILEFENLSSAQCRQRQTVAAPSDVRIDIVETAEIHEEEAKMFDCIGDDGPIDPNSCNTILRMICYRVRNGIIWIFQSCRGFFVQAFEKRPSNHQDTIEGIRKLVRLSHRQQSNASDKNSGEECESSEEIVITIKDPETALDFAYLAQLNNRFDEEDELQSWEANTARVGPNYEHALQSDEEIEEIFTPGYGQPPQLNAYNNCELQFGENDEEESLEEIIVVKNCEAASSGAYSDLRYLDLARSHFDEFQSSETNAYKPFTIGHGQQEQRGNVYRTNVGVELGNESETETSDSEESIGINVSESDITIPVVHSTQSIEDLTILSLSEEKDETPSTNSESSPYLLGPNDEYEVHEIFEQNKSDRTLTSFDNYLIQHNDYKAWFLNEKCDTVMWVFTEQSRIVLIYETIDPGKWSLLQWYRTELSDRALRDSIRIGHPYFWNSVVHRKLSRAVKQFRNLYRNIELKKLKELAKNATSEPTISVQRIRNNLARTTRSPMLPIIYRPAERLHSGRGLYRNEAPTTSTPSPPIPCHAARTSENLFVPIVGSRIVPSINRADFFLAQRYATISRRGFVKRFDQNQKELKSKSEQSVAVEEFGRGRSLVTPVDLRGREGTSDDNGSGKGSECKDGLEPVGTVIEEDAEVDDETDSECKGGQKSFGTAAEEDTAGDDENENSD